jgi:hypothetical protein
MPESVCRPPAGPEREGLGAVKVTQHRSRRYAGAELLGVSADSILMRRLRGAQGPIRSSVVTATHEVLATGNESIWDHSGNK